MKFERVAGFILNTEEKIPIIWEGDVLVAGGGPGGLGAAIAAHRQGAKTLLIEKNGFLGGMCSYGAGMPLGGAYPGLRTIGGIAEEILTMVREAGPDRADVRHIPLFGDWYFHDAEYFKSMIAKFVLDLGLNVRLHTVFSDVIMDSERHVKGVIVDSKSGRQALLAKTFIDATGDADLCARAGAGFEKGDENGDMMGVTLVYNIGGVDTDTFMTYYKEEDPGLKKAFKKAQSEGYPVSEDDKYTSIHKGVKPGSIFINAVRIRGIDGTDVESLTQGELQGRVRLMEEVNFLRQYVPGCADCYIMNTGSELGIRDTRRILGEDYLTEQDCRDLKKRPEVILRCQGPFDNTTRGHQKEYVLNDIDITQWYDIPYGCIVPKDLDNVVVSGRTFSCEALALTGSRGQALLMGLGQAAGTAAVMACAENIAFKDVDVKKLQAKLIEDGCDLGI